MSVILKPINIICLFIMQCREKELAKVVVKKEDIELIVSSLCW